MGEHDATKRSVTELDRVTELDLRTASRATVMSLTTSLPTRSTHSWRNSE